MVQKYGGSSVADVGRIQAVAKRVVETRRTGVDVVVVVSAMGNTTNELLSLASEISGNPGRRELDLLISVGERVSMTLLAMAIQELGEPAQSFTGSQSGIMTDTHHVAAQVLEVRPHRIRRALDEGQIAIVAGFQGVSLTGEVTTLGRGGSDTTAVVLTAALGAEYCEICSDVDGVYTADPRKIPEAKRMDTLSLGSAIQMANSGAKVLLAEALEQAEARGVTLMAGATNKPSGTGTRVVPGDVSNEVVGIARDNELYLLPSGIDLSSLSGSIVARILNGSALINARNLPPADSWSLKIEPVPVSTVSAIGKSLVTNPAITERAIQAVKQNAENPVWWSTNGQFTAMIKRGEADGVERSLHTALISTN